MPEASWYVPIYMEEWREDVTSFLAPDTCSCPTLAYAAGMCASSGHRCFSLQTCRSALATRHLLATTRVYIPSKQATRAKAVAIKAFNCNINLIPCLNFGSRMQALESCTLDSSSASPTGQSKTTPNASSCATA